jgi:glycosyltransferase involved in cell wall biosynthesis
LNVPEGGRRRRLYLECSETYRIDRHTGIQRVTRNVIRESVAQGAARGVDVIPVFYVGGTFREAKLRPDGSLGALPPPLPERIVPLRRAYRSVLRAATRVVPHRGARDWLVAPGTHPGLTRTIRALLGAPAPGAGAEDAGVVADHRAVDFARGDILFCVDLYVSAELGVQLRALHEGGVTIAALVYDLIPINRPRMWHPEFIVGFRAWLEMMIEWADILVSISATVRDELAAYARRERPDWPLANQRSEYFHLGHELDRRVAQPQVRPELAAVFADPGGPVFLNVGWLDPRKNQPFLIDALTPLWRRGIESRLLLVGKKGRGTEAVLRHLRREPLAATRVLHFDDLSDDELEFCYAQADALVYPSLEEGFGLPLVEALSRGLPVFASDIPVFHELAEGFVVFFRLDSPEELTGQLERFCRTREYPVTRRTDEFRWPSWKESVASLLDILLEPVPRTAER